MKNAVKRHHLFHGELTDAPGRDEVWDDYLIYQANHRWVLITAAQDLSGLGSSIPFREVMGSRQLLKWALDRDSEISEDARRNSTADEDDLDNGTRGPFIERLKEIAIEVGANYCVELIERWTRGTWPPTPTKRKMIVRGVLGVCRRGIWLKIYHDVFEVNTNLGPAYMYEPGEDGHATVILKNESSKHRGIQVKLSKANVENVDRHRPNSNSTSTMYHRMSHHHEKITSTY